MKQRGIALSELEERGVDPEPGDIDAKNVADIENDIDLIHNRADELGWNNQGLRVFMRLGNINARQKPRGTKRQTKQLTISLYFRATARKLKHSDARL